MDKFRPMLSRRDFLKLSGAAMLAASFPRLNFAGSDAPSAPIIYHGSRNYRKIAMTFDDCWHPEVLEQLNAMLQPYPDFHFTFFAVGDAIDIDEAVKPGIWKMLYESGHEIGYHTYHHEDPPSQNPTADFDQWMNTLHSAVGFEPRVHFGRPPGNYLTPSFEEICQQRGLVVTQFSLGFEAPNMADSMRLISQTTNGDIVQMHTYQDPPNGRFDVDVTAQAVPYLVKQGFSLVTMSELYDDLLREQYSSDGCEAGTGDSLNRTCLE